MIIVIIINSDLVNCCLLAVKLLSWIVQQPRSALYHKACVTWTRWPSVVVRLKCSSRAKSGCRNVNSGLKIIMIHIIRCISIRHNKRSRACRTLRVVFHSLLVVFIWLWFYQEVPLIKISVNKRDLTEVTAAQHNNKIKMQLMKHVRRETSSHHWR